MTNDSLEPNVESLCEEADRFADEGVEELISGQPRTDLSA